MWNILAIGLEMMLKDKRNVLSLKTTDDDEWEY